MSNEYWVYQDYFIFKPHFNEPVENYVNIIKDYKKLIFSDFNDLESNIYPDEKFIKYYTGSIFNKPLSNSFEQLDCLKELTFGNEFSQPLENSLLALVQLEKLTFGFEFSQPLGNSLSNLTQLKILIFGCLFNEPVYDSLNKLVQLEELKFDNNFNQPISNLLVCLTKMKKITLGKEFNQELFLPSNIKILKLDLVTNHNNQNFIDNLPNTIEELYLYSRFNLELNNLPNSIKKISFGKYSKYNKSLNNLPRSLEEINLPYGTEIEIKNKPENCKIIYL